MSDLRMALLVLGGVLILVIVVWELLHRRIAQRDADVSQEVAHKDPLMQTHRDAERRIEPSMSMTDIDIRNPVREPRLIDLDSAEMSLEDSGESIPIMGGDSLEFSTTLVAPNTPTIVSTITVGPVLTSPVTIIPELRLEWPPADRRQIIAIRVIARGEVRFTGSNLRQALLGEGFIFGEMEIFHRPIADGRVVLSAASLTNPGSFNLTTMDSGSFLGLNLFAVLPGPIPGAQVVEKLLSTGNRLAQRLVGDVLGAKGQALDSLYLAQMKSEAVAADLLSQPVGN